MATQTTLSFDDFIDAGKAEALIRRPELNIYEGDISEMLLAGSAAMAETTLADATRQFSNTFINAATGDDLHVLVEDRFRIPANDAQSGTGTISWSRASASAGAGTISAGTVVATSPDAQGNTVQVMMDVDLDWGSSESGTKTVTGTAIVAGTAGNVSSSTLTNIVSSVFDSTFTVTNVSAFAGGTEEESDENYRIRAFDYLNTIRRGTLSALEYGAKTIPGITYATPIEGNGIVSIYIADSAGNSSDTLVAQVKTEIENWRSAGIIVNIIGASVLIVTPIIVALSVRPGVDKVALTPNIKQSIVNRLNRLKIGEQATMAQFYQSVLNVAPDGITDATITVTLPSVLPNQACRTLITEITVI